MQAPRTAPAARAFTLKLQALNFRKPLGSAIAPAVIALAVASGASAQNDCSMPEVPSMPDGSSASMEEMLAGQQAVKAFQADNMDYMQCLEAQFQAAEARAKSSRDDSVRDSAEAVYRDAVEAYNTAVSTEEEVARAFNVALREYKAANK